MKRTVVKILAVFLAALAAYSGCRAWAVLADYKAEENMRGQVAEYKPRPVSAVESVINQSVIDLQAIHPDVAGWLYIPGTEIDYPFVWYENNDHYLRRDLNGGGARAGTIFMDYRCDRAFSSSNTILYGHHMKNGSMFGTVKLFADEAFFNENLYGTVYLPRETLTLAFFAYMEIRSTDSEIYSLEPSETYMAYVRQTARHCRDTELAQGDRIVTLSTCAYASGGGARAVLVGKVV